MSEAEHPCAGCVTHYGCCSLKGSCGLMLTREEFEKHFEGYAEKLVVRSAEHFVIISSRHGCTCPHLSDDGCRIYQDRPVDCQLFPYMMSHVFHNRRRVRIVFHDKSDCPHQALIIQTPEAARVLARKFGQAVFGSGMSVVADFEERKTVVTRLHNLADKMLARAGTLLTRSRRPLDRGGLP